MTQTIAGLTVVGFDPIMLRGDPGPQGPAGPPGSGSGGTSVVDNGDGTFTASSTSGSVVDNGNGTFTIS